MHGAGVFPREAFPARFEHHLNAGIVNRMFLTENWGVRRTNLWNAIHLFRDRALPRGCDAAVFSVCINDCNLFENILFYPNPIEGDEQNRLWRDMRSEIETSLVRLRRMGEERGIPIVLVWFGSRFTDRPAVEILTEICERVGLPFIDGLGFFQSMGYEDGDARLMATPVDSHLSALGLDLLARHAALKIGHLFSTPATDTTASPTIDISTAMDAVEAAGDEVAALRWGDAVLAAKDVAVRRSRSREGVETTRKALETLRSRIAERFGRWRDEAVWNAVLDGLKADARLLAEIDAISRSALEVIECARCFPDTPFAEGVRLDAQRKKLSDLPIPDRDARLSRMAAIDSALARVADRVEGRDDLRLIWRLLTDTCRHVATTADRFAELGGFETLPASVSDLARWASNEIGRCFGRLERIAGRWDRLRNAVVVSPVFHSRVDLYVRCPNIPSLREALKFWYIEVKADYVAPSFISVVDGHLLILDGEPHLHRLEIPLMIAGSLTMNLYGADLSSCPRGLGMIERIVFTPGSGGEIKFEHDRDWEGSFSIRVSPNGATQT